MSNEEVLFNQICALKPSARVRVLVAAAACLLNEQNAEMGFYGLDLPRVDGSKLRAGIAVSLGIDKCEELYNYVEARGSGQRTSSCDTFGAVDVIHERERAVREGGQPL